MTIDDYRAALVCDLEHGSWEDFYNTLRWMRTDFPAEATRCAHDFIFAINHPTEGDTP